MFPAASNAVAFRKTYNVAPNEIIALEHFVQLIASNCARPQLL